MNNPENSPRRSGSSTQKLVAKIKPATLAETDPFKKSQRLPALSRIKTSKVRGLPVPAHDCEFENFYHL